MITFFISILALLAYWALRIYFVGNQRKKLLLEISNIADTMLHKNPCACWELLYHKLEAYSYEHMLFSNPFKFRWTLKDIGIMPEDYK